MKYLGIVFAALFVAGAGFVWYSGQPRTLSTTVLCDGIVELVARSFSIGEGGRSYRIEGSFVQDSQRKLIFTIYDVRSGRFGSGRYIPLPINTSIPVVAIETPQKDSYGEEAPDLINILVDPSEISRTDFDKVGLCLKTNAQAMNTMLAETPNMNVRSGKYPQRFGGLAYISFNDFYSRISSVNTDSPSNGDSGDYKMVNEVGAVIFDSYYIGDIFSGIGNVGELNISNSKNSRGENIYQYISRLQTELRAH